jgi:hypothetical protein
LRFPFGPSSRQALLPDQQSASGVDLGSRQPTLFLVAGPCGSGKSSVIKTVVQADLALFGDDLRAEFRGSVSDRSGCEVDDYNLAFERQSCFQASHVKRLSRESTLPSCLLLHLDLYQILRGIDASYWPKGLKRKLQRLSDVSEGLSKRSFEDLLKPRQNDRMMQAFLDKNLFRRFARIAVATVHCSFERNATQLAARKRGSSGQWLKYFSAPDPVARAIHAEIYRCWASALVRMAPVVDVSIKVDSDEGFSLNGSFIAYGR